MAQNIMDSGEVKSGCVLTTLKNKIKFLQTQKPTEGSWIPKFDAKPCPGFAHSLGMVSRFQGREVFSWMSGGQCFQPQP